ncbi:MAG: hypothetical protein BroJett022_20980 [Actinomycetes bacterium]|nr:MAG: hypothetical protein BroJett022_20980 [Actinomycetes bacterium]
MAAGYWPRPWTCEDGGPRRWGTPGDGGGLGIAPGERLEVVAARDAFATDALVRREPGELFALRNDLADRGGRPLAPVECWVERLDSESMAPLARSRRLPAGAWWPGGIAAHANGDLYVVSGAWAHRLDPGLAVLASHRLPADRPHNSFVLLDGGELVVKDCDVSEAREPATVSALDPETLLPVAPPLRLPEASIARLASDGESAIALGTTRAFRLRLDRGRGRIVLDGSWRPAYGPAPGRSYGWDPVITDQHVLWLDNGRNRTDRTMLGSGIASDPLRLWWARRDDGRIDSTEVSGIGRGTVSNPPGWDPEGGIVVGYDSGNAVVAAWRIEGDALVRLWRRDGIAHAGHLIVHPDTRELVAGDWRDRSSLRHPAIRAAAGALSRRFAASARLRRASLRTGHDRLVVLDLDTGAGKAAVDVPSPVQSFNFPAPGFGRDVYYQSLTTIARIAVTADGAGAGRTSPT